jgi:hypothetical protein
MNRVLLIRKISAIHAIKCLRSDDFKIAELSFISLDDLRTRINDGADDIEKLVNEYANRFPIVSDSDIESFMRGIRN